MPLILGGDHMELKLYSTSDNENVINKTLDLRYVINIKLKATTDIVTPDIVLNDEKNMDFKTCNYAYLSDFNRYYFIRTIKSMNNHTWHLSLECDVLESFKEDIFNSYVEITRPLKQGEYYTVGGKVQTIKEIDIFKSDTTLKSEHNIILSTIGGT